MKLFATVTQQEVCNQPGSMTGLLELEVGMIINGSMNIKVYGTQRQRDRDMYKIYISSMMNVNQKRPQKSPQIFFYFNF